MSPRKVWVSPLRVTLAFKTVPERPATLITDGDGVAVSTSLITMAAGLAKVALVKAGVTTRAALPLAAWKFASPA